MALSVGNSRLELTRQHASLTGSISANLSKAQPQGVSFQCLTPARNTSRSSRSCRVQTSAAVSNAAVVSNAAEVKAAAASTAAAEADKFLAGLLAKIEGGKGANAVVVRLNEESRTKAASMHWPKRKDEAFRFTDVKPLLDLDCVFGSQADAAASNLDLAQLSLGVPLGYTLVTVNGVLQRHLSSNLDSLPSGLIVGALGDLPEDVVSRVVSPYLGRIATDGDVFSEINGASAADVILVLATQGSDCSACPIHIIHATSASGASAVANVAAPRVLIVAESDSEVEVVEEFVAVGETKGSSAGAGEGCYWVNAVAEVAVAKGAKVVHGVVQEQNKDAFHVKATAVQQEEASEYTLIEAQLGGRLSRHNLRMKQLGPDTLTNVSTFSLCGARQLQDLHSSLVLDHPRGVTRQLHKCIVTESTGLGVFDGNVQVNRYAQQTDAGQLTRSLLLAPRGTVNVKPNLQIVADDVKCTHGAAISDLDDEQLFYFQARGINESTARSALVFSFAAEVVEKFPYKKLRTRLENSLKTALSAQGAMDSSVAAGLKGVDA